MLEKYGFTGTLLATVTIVCLCSSWEMGYNLGVINLPKKSIEEFFHIEVFENKSTEGKVVTSSFLYGQASAVFVIFAAAGAFSSGFVADYLGRRNGLMANHLFAIIGAVLSSICVVTRVPALLFVGRAFSGVNSGIIIGVASIYLMELAPRNLRGGIGACHQLAVTIGILSSYVLTADYAFKSYHRWPIAIGLGAVPAFLGLIIFPFLPKSPRYIYINKNDEVQARQLFLRLNLTESVDNFIAELKEEQDAVRNQPKFKFIQLFKMRELRIPVLIACLLQILQQLSGINAVIAFSSSMLQLAGVPENSIDNYVIGLGLLNVVMTIVSLPLLERTGRRVLLLWPTVLLAFSLFFLTIFVTLASKSNNSTYGIVSVIFIFLYICGFALGLGPIPAMLVGEIFRQAPRAAAYSLSQSCQWLSNLLVLASYQSIKDAIGGYSFIPFLVVVVICWIFFFLFMPETRNRTFDDIAKDLVFFKLVPFQKKTSLDSGSMMVANKSNSQDDKPYTENLLHSPKYT